MRVLFSDSYFRVQHSKQQVGGSYSIVTECNSCRWMVLVCAQNRKDPKSGANDKTGRDISQ